MPNRIIKESIRTSEDVNRMTDFQFRLWVSLITYVDDYGRGDARPEIIKGSCFPLRDRITKKDIEAALEALADIGCVSLYEVDGKPYLYFPTWESHQRIQTKKSRFPAPDIEENAIHRDSPSSTVSHRESPPESNPNPNPNPNPKENPNPNPNRAGYAASEALNEAITNFIEFRKKIKKPMTDLAVELLLKELNKLSNSEEEQIAIINQSILNGWQGVFALKEGGTNRENRGTSSFGRGSRGTSEGKPKRDWNIEYSG